jgi:antitoxin CcdA
MNQLYDASAPRKATNLSVNSDLLRKARECGLNLSAVMEAALVEEIRKAQRERWLAENREAIDAYNEDIERNGVFSDGLRSF